MANSTRFAGYPSAVVYDQPTAQKKAVQHLLWGDWLRLKNGRQGGFVEVHARGVDGWMREEDIQKERLLEVVFVDIGQGDGCLLVTPDDKHMVIDAGEGDNMMRFLRWRYGAFQQPWKFECAVISHPDQDHYGGFDALFDERNVSFGTIYHNGIVERTGANSLGRKTLSGTPRYLTELVTNETELQDFFSAPSRWKQKKYPKMLHKGFTNGRFSRFRMLSMDDGFLPGYALNGKELTVRVLGPVVNHDADKPRLEWFSDAGKTKNGHSVVLRVQYRNVSLLLGGDLNIPSQNLLLEHHTGLKAPPKSAEEHTAMVAAARKVFEVDIAKSCHHGSSDVSTVFLAATHPIATVISSGDDEPHSHPRADTLGAIGVHGRGLRPLIFSTELARSTKESVKHPHVLQARISQLQKEIDQAPTGTKAEQKRKQKLEQEFQKLVGSIDRSIAVFGAIQVRTNGRKVVVAQKLEQPRSLSKKWDIYQLESSGNGPLAYVSKH